MRKRKLLSKEKIQQIIRQYKQRIPDIEQLGAMAKTGLRASEICNLKLKNLPSYHGKPKIKVKCGKGQKSRAVGVSEWFAARLTAYVHRYLGSTSPESWLFRSERGGPIKYASIYAKIKRIGIKSGI